MTSLREMTKRKKVEYIWDYYKIHIIITTIVFIGLISFIHGQITKINYEFNLTIIGSSLGSEKIEKFEKDLIPIVIKNPSKNQSVQIDIMPIDNLTGGQGVASPQYMQKFMVELNASVIDLLILNKKDFDVYQKQNAFLRIDEIKGMELASIKAEKITGAPDNGVYGINIQDNKLLMDFGVNTKDKVLCIPASTNRNDKAILAVKWILGIN
ncbi:MAG: hypothetical protein H7Y18_14565 [Clostridiaceae bacterium]|nr:hypothetical protein [Clostridiaceae bacterium]